MTFTRHKFIWTKEKALFAYSEKVLLISDVDAFFPPTFLYSVKTEYIFRWDLQYLLFLISDHHQQCWAASVPLTNEHLFRNTLCFILLSEQEGFRGFICLWRIALSTGFNSCWLWCKLALTFIFELRGSGVANVKQNKDLCSHDEF